MPNDSCFYPYQHQACLCPGQKQVEQEQLKKKIKGS